VDKFAVVIHREPEGGFWAEVPALPGCYSQGETVDELMETSAKLFPACWMS
jgi:predicted RNase H-like HicB family nuclease